MAVKNDHFKATKKVFPPYSHKAGDAFYQAPQVNNDKTFSTTTPSGKSKSVYANFQRALIHNALSRDLKV